LQGSIGGVEQRPLWRRIVDYPLVAMVIAVALYIVATVIAGALDALAMPPIRGFTFETKFDLLAIPLLIILYELVIRRLGEHPRDDYRDPFWVRRLAIGLGLGLAVFSLAVAIAAALGVYRVTGEGDLSRLMPALLAAAIFPAISEEMLFRGILFRWIEEFGGSWAALIVSSILFGAAHALNPGSSIVATSFIAVEAGLLLGGAYMLTRSLWFPMGIHAAWNFTQGEIYDIPVSGLDQHGLLQAKLSGPSLLTGGSFGLEASVLTLVVATAVGVCVVWLAVRKGEVVRPRWVRRRRLTAAA
jgi:membrane protease YdiL (CAAX protease family)